MIPPHLAEIALIALSAGIAMLATSLALKLIFLWWTT